MIIQSNLNYSYITMRERFIKRMRTCIDSSVGRLKGPRLDPRYLQALSKLYTERRFNNYREKRFYLSSKVSILCDYITPQVAEKYMIVCRKKTLAWPNLVRLDRTQTCIYLYEHFFVQRLKHTELPYLVISCH